MKTTNPLNLLLVSILGFSSLTALAAENAAKSGQIEVKFHEPTKFTDIGDREDPSPAAREADLKDIRSYLTDQAPRLIGAGRRLEVTFLDIDKAGGFEPGRRPSTDDIRIVKVIYPPALKLAFRLTDAEGKVLKQGTRELRDLNFLQRLPLVDRSDPLVYEKNMLDDWLRDEFAFEPKA
jgi:hypothetical protein